MLKVLLVDDEQIVLKGIQYVLSKCSHLCQIVGTAVSGQNGLDMIDRLHPDVVITDVKMPDIDGIELIKRAKRKYPHLYFVILSGHADFEFARNALRYGAYDYLLKPCKHKDISRLLETIDNDIKNKRQDGRIQEELEQDLKDSKKEIERRKLLDVLLEKNSEDDLPMEFYASRLIVIEYNDKIISNDTIISLLIDTKFEQLLSEYKIEVLYYRNRCIFLLNVMCNLNTIKEHLYHLKLKIIKLGSSVWGGISDVYEGIDGLKDGYKQCNVIIEYLRFNEICEIRSKDELKNQYGNREDMMEDKIFDEDSIIKKIFLGQSKDLQQELTQCIYKMTRSNPVYNPATLRTQMKQFMILIEKKLKEKQITLVMIFDRPVESIYEIQKIKNYRQLLNWCKNMLISICQYIEENKRHLPKSIQKALNYIDNNYQEDISMKQIADHVYLNPWYFSDLFKEKMGIPFSDYLTKIRINHAKKLLVGSDLKNYEIAERVGFRNATYFNVVFKKVEGLTPKAYRKSM